MSDILGFARSWPIIDGDGAHPAISDLMADVRRLITERDAWSDEAAKMLKERNAILGLLTSLRGRVQATRLRKLLDAIEGDNPTEEIRVLAGLPRTGANP